MPTFNLMQLVIYGLAGYGTYELAKNRPKWAGGGAMGRRGSLQEAAMWEMGGHPSQTNMMGGRGRRANRR